MVGEFVVAIVRRRRHRTVAVAVVDTLHRPHRSFIISPFLPPTDKDNERRPATTTKLNIKSSFVVGVVFLQIIDPQKSHCFHLKHL